MMKLIPFFSIFSLLISCAAVMHAEENAVEPTEQQVSESKTGVSKTAEAKLSETEISKLIEQLDSDSFALREAAVTDLIKAGMAAVPKVMEAAQGESLETSTRAFDVLDKWISGEDPLVKTAAKGALERLAGGDENSKVVRRSKALLAKSNTVQSASPGVNPFGRAAPVRVLRGGVARVELRAVAGVAAAVRGRTMRVSIANGKKTIQVTEGDLQAKIVEDAKEGIQIEVTKKGKDGKAKTTKYAAKDLDELKEKHPEGHKVYEKYAGKLIGLKIKMQAAKARAVPKPVERPVEKPAKETAEDKAVEEDAAKAAGDKAEDAE